MSKSISSVSVSRQIKNKIIDCFKLSHLKYDQYEHMTLVFDETLKNEHETSSVLHDVCHAKEDQSIVSNDTDISVYYVSDLHLPHKLKERGAKTKRDIQKDIEDLVQQLFSDIVKNDGGYKIVLIGGDISSDLYIYRIFIETIRKYRMASLYTRIIFTLGNHELWAFPEDTFEDIVTKYRDYLKENHITLLQNDLIFIDYDQRLHMIPENELENMDISEIQNSVRDASFVLFGGIGFSGYNEYFNAKNGIYSTTICRKEEIALTKQFEDLYDKVATALPYKEAIIFTHMPMDCWREKVEYQSGYIYVSGHTHRNMFYDDGETRIYADNQAGYKDITPYFKEFYMDRDNDYYDLYEDGIYEITSKEYIRFYRGKTMFITFNRKVNHLYMLKKKGYYCFICENASGNLCILNGGRMKRIKNKDIKFYYDDMDRVIETLMTPLEKFTKIQKKVSEEIRKIGGNGIIHGAIIDIDFYNHIYVNPYDLSLTSYYAEDIVNKVVYPSVPDLLEENCQEIYYEYCKLVNEKGKELPAISNSSSNMISKPIVYLDTDIYKASNKLKAIQKLNSNILTEWLPMKEGNVKIKPIEER